MKPWVLYRQGLDCPGKVIAQMVVYRGEDWYVDKWYRRIMGAECLREVLPAGKKWLAGELALVLRLFDTPGPGRVHVNPRWFPKSLCDFDGLPHQLTERAESLLSRHVRVEAWLSVEG